MHDLANKLFKDDYRLKAPNKVEHLLRRVAASREPLAVLPLSQGETFNSLLLHVDAAKGELVIDELNPPRGTALLAGAAPFLAMGRSDGVYVGFRSHLLRKDVWEGYGALRIAYPENLFHLQRRSFFRVLVSASDIGQVEVQRRGARAMQGQCQDVSANGMRLRLQAPTDYALTEGEFLPVVRFSLGGMDLASEAQVRFVSATRSGLTRQPMRTVGLRFTNMPPLFEQRLMAYVQRRDRELLRDARA
jgi:c-di-GMP-binding flagellar brake protein YcgR